MSLFYLAFLGRSIYPKCLTVYSKCPVPVWNIAGILTWMALKGLGLIGAQIEKDWVLLWGYCIYPYTAESSGMRVWVCMVCSRVREGGWAQLDLPWSWLSSPEVWPCRCLLNLLLNCFNVRIAGQEALCLEPLYPRPVRARAVWMDQRAIDGLDTIRHHQCHAVFQLRENQWEKTLIDLMVKV